VNELPLSSMELSLEEFGSWSRSVYETAAAVPAG